MSLTKMGVAIWLLLSPCFSQAEIKNAKVENAIISGSCTLCKEGIEAAAFQKNTSMATWDKDSKMAVVTYDAKKTSMDAVLKRIALAGYDNDSYLAPDAAYAKLEKCCQYERPGRKDVAAGNTAGLKDQAPIIVKDVNKVSETLQPVFDAYFSMKDALVNTDGTAAASHASALANAIKAVKMEKLETEAHQAWMKVQKSLSADAANIAETKDPARQRELFTTLSVNMYTLLKSAKNPETVYYQHCPMFNDGKGAYWLSKTSAVKNPYYGAQMLSCGKTTETIK